MSKLCSKCGFANDESDKYCNDCGNMLSNSDLCYKTPKVPDQIPEETQENKKINIDVAQGPNASKSFSADISNGTQASSDSRSAQSNFASKPANGSDSQMSVGQYLLDIFLYSLPVVGLVLSIVWSLSKSETQTRRNFAKATLIWKCIGVGVLALFYILFFILYFTFAFKFRY